MRLNFLQKIFVNMRIVRIFLISFFICIPLEVSGSSGDKMPKHEWSFEGFTGIFDRAALQRGFKVYREVC